jgi:hypothetical protein
MKKIRLPQNPLQPLQTGQLWELDKSFLRIGEIGKLLIQYKHYRGKARVGPTSFASKSELEKYLTDNKAVLVQE